MKKKISLLLCALIMVLSVVGCSDNKEAESQYDQATLEQSAEFIISNFSQMGEADFEQFKVLSEYQLDYTMMQTGLKVSGEDFLGMISSWEAAEKECGEYVSHGDYEVEVKSDGVVLSTMAEYKDRDAEISFSFDENSFMKSMDVSAKFSIREILTKAGLNTVLGMGIVFVVLIFLAYLIDWIKYIPMLIDKTSKKTKEAPKESSKETKPIMAAPVATEVSDDLELIAVITAAIAAQEGTSTDGFVVRSIRRRPSNNWK